MMSKLRHSEHEIQALGASQCAFALNSPSKGPKGSFGESFGPTMKCHAPPLFRLYTTKRGGKGVSSVRK